MLAPFVEADSVDAAVDLLEQDLGYRMIGGGTGLMLMARSGFFEPTGLISLRTATEPELHAVTASDDRLHIGGQRTLAALERDALVSARVPVLAEALHRLSSPRTRNVATVAGCVAHADPHMDLPPVLVALDAEVEIVGRQGRRYRPCSELFRGYYDIDLEPGELIGSVRIPLGVRGRRTVYRKFTGGLVEDWPLVGVAVGVDVDHDEITAARVVVAAVEPAVRRIPQIEHLLVNARLADVDAAAIGDALAEAVEPIDDHLASAWYKRQIVAVEGARAVRELINGAPNE